MNEVYELAEIEPNGPYWTLGLFETEELAARALDEIVDPALQLPGEWEREGRVVVETRRRPLNRRSTEPDDWEVVRRRVWTEEYDEDADEYRWKERDDVHPFKTFSNYEDAEDPLIKPVIDPAWKVMT